MHDYYYICSQFCRKKLYSITSAFSANLQNINVKKMKCTQQCNGNKNIKREKKHWIKQEVLSIILLEILYVILCLWIDCTSHSFFFSSNIFISLHMCIVFNFDSSLTDIPDKNKEKNANRQWKFIRSTYVSS